MNKRVRLFPLALIPLLLMLTNLVGASPLHDVIADYDAELRQPGGRVDVDAMVARLKALGVTSYYWLIWHAPTDWDDLKLFLPKAAQAGIEVSVFLVPPSESPPHTNRVYSEPFRLDYPRWAEEIAQLSLQHPNLTGWVMDDFNQNHALFTPAYVREMQARAKKINPHLVFLPAIYYGEITPRFVNQYREVIDGVVAAYPQDREEIDRAWALLNDAPMPLTAELDHPWEMPSKAGDFVMVGQTAKVMPSERAEIRFREQDDYTGPTSGYHFMQLLVDDEVVWEADVAGGPPAAQAVVVDVTRMVRDKRSVTIAFRLLDKKGVANLGVYWRVRDLQTTGLQLAADLAKPQMWQVNRRGVFETNFDPTRPKASRRFHIPYIVMTAGQTAEFRMRHGDPATPERIAEWLRMSLQAWRDGKCDGVVTYCLNKHPESQSYLLAQKLFFEFRK